MNRVACELEALARRTGARSFADLAFADARARRIARLESDWQREQTAAPGKLERSN